MTGVEMIYRSGVFSKRDGMTDAQFRQHWREIHGELASHLPGLHSYRQNHIVERIYEAAPFPGHEIYGISQLNFDDVAAMERMEVSSEYAACKVDIPMFQGAITILVLQETHVSQGHPAAPGGARSKLLLVSMARGDKPLDQAAAEASSPASHAAPLRIVHNAVVDRSHPVAAGVPQGDLPITGMTEFWFDNAASLNEWIVSAAGKQRLFADPLDVPMGIYAIEEIRIV
jgi:uncharacterized protein (TIGR02118 family)